MQDHQIIDWADLEDDPAPKVVLKPPSKSKAERIQDRKKEQEQKRLESIKKLEHEKINRNDLRNLEIQSDMDACRDAFF